QGRSANRRQTTVMGVQSAILVVIGRSSIAEIAVGGNGRCGGGWGIGTPVAWGSPDRMMSYRVALLEDRARFARGPRAAGFPGEGRRVPYGAQSVERKLGIERLDFYPNWVVGDRPSCSIAALERG